MEPLRLGYSLPDTHGIGLNGWRSRNLQQEGGPGHRPKSLLHEEAVKVIWNIRECSHARRPQAPSKSRIFIWTVYPWWS